MKKLWPIVAVLLFLNACAGRKPVVNEYNENVVLAFIDEIVTASATEPSASPVNLPDMVARMEELCESGFTLPLYENLALLLQDGDKAAALDEVVIYAPRRQHNYLGALVAQEFLFRFLQGCQLRLEDYFQNVHNRQRPTQTIAGPGSEYIYTFEQNVGDLLPVMQAQTKYSQKRTDLLLDMLASYQLLQQDVEKERFWLAIERMLARMNLARSDTGYEMFQRQADGLMTPPADVLATLNRLATAEQSAAVQAKAYAVIQRLQNNLEKPLTRDDLSLISTVELNREFMRHAKADIARGVQTQQEQTGHWFDLAYAAPDPAQKIAYYTHAIAADSGYAPAYNNRGNAYQAVGDYAAARADYDRALALDPAMALAHKNRGSLSQLEGDYARAVADFDRAIELDPTNAVCYADRGNALLKLGEYEKALADLNQCLHSGGAPAPVLNTRGLCYEKLDEVDLALVDFAAAIDIDPVFAESFVNRGNLYRRLKKDDLAIRDYTRALELEPANSRALNGRAISYKNTRQYNLAIADHRQALALNPDDPVAYYNLGCVYWELRQWSEVVAAWQKCLDYEPEHAQVLSWLPIAQEAAKKRR